MIKQFTRIFHPIGQGAFYTEKIVTESKDYNIVYDCGSSTLMPPGSKGNKLQKYINNSFHEKEEIDLLFISHFHADHINGLDFLKDRCKIKKVVMPLLDDTAKILARISLVLERGNTDIVDNPESYFGSDTDIIFVNFNPENIQEEAPETIQERITYTIESLGNIGRINSGVSITIATSWYYIPYNYEMTNRSNKFKEELKNLGLSISDIDTIDKIEKHKKEIITAYEKVNRNLNPHSLILYSGNFNIRIETFYKHYYNPFHYYHSLHEVSSGCLYLGDIDLNQANIVQNIKSRLYSYRNNISTIQIPHHGSIENYEKSILFSSMRFAILSYGTTNTYGHPSSLVQSSLHLHRIYPFHITEFQNSIVFQFNDNTSKP